MANSHTFAELLLFAFVNTIFDVTLSFFALFFFWSENEMYIYERESIYGKWNKAKTPMALLRTVIYARSSSRFNQFVLIYCCRLCEGLKFTQYVVFAHDWLACLMIWMTRKRKTRTLHNNSWFVLFSLVSFSAYYYLTLAAAVFASLFSVFKMFCCLFIYFVLF